MTLHDVYNGLLRKDTIHMNTLGYHRMQQRADFFVAMDGYSKGLGWFIKKGDG